MANRPFNLAIETSSRHGSLSLGCGDRLLGSVALDQSQRHNIDLMPGIDAIVDRHGATAGQIGEVYVSIGPGSFTGLRIAVATAKMLAIAGGASVVAVSTTEVIARNCPPDVAHLAVCLNCKRDRVYAGLFRRAGDTLQLTGQPCLMTMAQVLAQSPRPLALIGAPLPDPDGSEPQAGDAIRRLPPQLAIPQSNQLWHLGREAKGRTTDPLELLPLYAREPEAVELWKKRRT